MIDRSEIRLLLSGQASIQQLVDSIPFGVRITLATALWESADDGSITFEESLRAYKAMKQTCETELARIAEEGGEDA